MRVKEGLVYNNSNGELIGFCDSKSVNTCIKNLEEKSQKLELLYYCLWSDE